MEVGKVLSCLVNMMIVVSSMELTYKMCNLVNEVASYYEKVYAFMIINNTILEVLQGYETCRVFIPYKVPIYVNNSVIIIYDKRPFVINIPEGVRVDVMNISEGGMEFCIYANS